MNRIDRILLDKIKSAFGFLLAMFIWMFFVVWIANVVHYNQVNRELFAPTEEAYRRAFVDVVREIMP